MFKKLALLVLSGFFSLTVLTAQVMDIELVSGWNLVSLPLAQKTVDLDGLFNTAALDGSGSTISPETLIRRIWGFNGSWQWYIPGNSGSTLTEIDANRGYWIMAAQPGKLRITAGSPRPVFFERSGWALAGTMVTEVTKLNDILKEENITSNHSVSNIRRIWQYADNRWDSSTPADGFSGNLQNFLPGKGYWFFLQSLTENPIPPAMEIGTADSTPVLVIGGATDLIPPETQSSPSPSISRISPSISRSQSTVPEPALEAIVCNANNHGLKIGHARLLTIAGESIKEAAVYCNFSAEKSNNVTYSIGLSQKELDTYQLSPESARELVLSVKLGSGQEVRSLIGQEVSAALRAEKSAVEKTVGTTSSLITGIVGTEISRRAGSSKGIGAFAADYENKQPDNRDFELENILRQENMDIAAFSEQATEAISSAGSLIAEMHGRFAAMNRPENFLDGETKKPAQDMERAMTDTDEKSQSLRELSAQSLRLLSNGTEENDNERAELADISKGLMSATTRNDLFDATGLLVSLLDLQQNVQGQAGMQPVSQALQQMKTDLIRKKGQLSASSDGNSAALIATGVLNLPAELVHRIAAIPEAAANLAETAGQVEAVKSRIENDQNEIKAELEKNHLLLQELLSATNQAEKAGLLTRAIGSASVHTSAPAALLKNLSELPPAAEMAAGLGKNSLNAQSAINALIGVLQDATEAMNLVSVASRELSTAVVGSILSNPGVGNGFGLNRQLFASAGPEREIRVNPGQELTVLLDGSASFDSFPSNSPMSYQWFLLENNEEQPLSAASNNPQTHVSLTLQGEKKIFDIRLRISKTDGRSAMDETIITLYTMSVTPPVIVAPNAVVAHAGEKFRVDASNSFDPEFASGELSFSWQLGSQTKNTAIAEFTINEEGLHQMILSVTKTAAGKSAVRTIPVRILKSVPPVAEVVFPHNIEEGHGGIRPFNISYSPMGGSIECAWEPENWFDTPNICEPLFLPDKPGEYPVTMTITENRNDLVQKVRHTKNLRVRKGRPPLAVARTDKRVLDFSSESAPDKLSLELNGSGSIGYAQDEPVCTWSGPELNNATGCVINLELDASNYPAMRKLRYNLLVQDSFGESKDLAEITIIPASRAPIAIVQNFPAKTQYEANETIWLDASASILFGSGTPNYTWEILGGASEWEIQDNSRLRLKVAPANQDGTLRVSFVITQDGKSGFREVSLPIKGAKQPPQLSLSPQYLSLYPGENAFLNALCRNDLPLQWDFNESLLEKNTADSSSFSLALQVNDSVSTAQTTMVTATVTDPETGLQTKAHVIISIRPRPAQKPPFLHVSPVPAINTSGQFCPTYDSINQIWTCNENDTIVLSGATASMNGNGVNLRAKLVFHDESERLFHESSAGLSGSVAAFVISTTLPAGIKELVITASDSAAEQLSTTSTMALFISSAHPNLPEPEIRLLAFSALSSGKVVISSHETIALPDHFVSLEFAVTYNGERPSAAHGYRWTAGWKDGIASPLVWFADNSTHNALLSVPISDLTVKRVLKTCLKIHSIANPDNNTESCFEQELLRTQAIQAPIAIAGTYSAQTADQSGFANVRLNGGNSLSPAGLELEYLWEYPAGGNVFNGTSQAQSAETTATLPVGWHDLRLTVRYKNNPEYSSIDNVRIRVDSTTADIWYDLLDLCTDMSPTETRTLISNRNFQCNLYALRAGDFPLSDPYPLVSNMTLLNSAGNTVYSVNGSRVLTFAFPEVEPGNYTARLYYFLDYDQNNSYSRDGDKCLAKTVNFNYEKPFSTADYNLSLTQISDNPLFAGSDSVNFRSQLVNPWHSTGNWIYDYRWNISGPQNFSGQSLNNSNLNLDINQVFTQEGYYTLNLSADIRKTDSTAQTTISTTRNITIFGPITAPQNITATPGDEKVTLNWSAVPNASHYYIYYGNTSCLNSSSNRISASTSPTVISSLQNDHIYYFALSTVSVTGEESLLSSEVSTTPFKPILQYGDVLWEFESERGISFYPSVGVDNTIHIISGERKILAINPDGTKKWEFETISGIMSLPVLDATNVLYAGAYRKIYAINPDGAKKWETEIEGNIISSLAIDINGTIYVTSFGTKIYAINPDGSQKWKLEVEEQSASSPVIGANGIIYINSFNKIYAINPDGSIEWKTEVGGTIESSLAIGPNGTIYTASSEPKIYAINPDGSKRWQVEIGGQIGRYILIGADNTIYAESENKIYAINPDGSEKWVSIEGSYLTSPTIGLDNTIYTLGNDNQLSVFSSDGKIKWENFSEKLIQFLPVIGKNGDIYAIENNKIYSIFSEISDLNLSPWPKIGGNNRNSGQPLLSLILRYNNELFRKISLNTGENFNLSEIEGYFYNSDLNSSTAATIETWILKSGVGNITDSNYSSNVPGEAILQAQYQHSINETTSVTYATEIKFTVGTLESLSLSHYSTDLYLNEQYDLTNIIVTANYAGGYSQIIQNPVWTASVGSISGTTYTAPSTMGSYALTASWFFGSTIKTIDFVVNVEIAEGTKIWEFRTEERIETSPAIDPNGVIYVGSFDNKLYAINPNGTKLWEFETGGFIRYSSPAISTDGIIYVGSNDNKFYAINPNGAKKWEFLTEGEIYSSPAIGIDGTIYVGSEGTLYAINPDGAKKWELLTGGGIYSSPAIGVDGTIYVGSGSTLYAINPNGTKLWEFLTVSTINSSPAIDSNNTIYIGSYDHKLYAINPNGTKKWEFTTGSYVYSSPTIGTDGTIYVGSNDKKLYAINPSGTKKWEFLTGGPIHASPIIGDDEVIYVAGYDGKLYAINPNGTKLWEFLTESYVYSSPTIGINGTVYVGSYDYKLYAIKSNSMGLADSPWPKFGGNAQNTGMEPFRISLLTPSSANSTPESTYNLSDIEVTIRHANGTEEIMTDAVWSIVSGEGSVNNNIYTAPSTEQIVTLKCLYSLHGNNKSKLFKVSVIAEPASHTIGASSRSAVAMADDGSYYIGTEDGKVQAFYANGSLKWAYTTGGSVRSGPVIGTDGTVYCGSLDNKLYAFNNDGSLKWQFTTGGQIHGSPALDANGNIYVGSDDGKMYAINASGQQIWQLSTSGGIRVSPAVGANGNIYFGNNNSNFYAVDNAGNIIWTITTGGLVRSPAAIGSDGTLFFGCFDNKLYAVNPADGSILWEFLSDNEFRSAPVIGTDGTIYTGNVNGNFYALNPDGTKKWHFATGADAILSSAIVDSNGETYFADSNGIIYSLNTTGELNWFYHTGGTAIYGSPLMNNDGKLYFSANDKIYIFNTNSTGLAISPWPIPGGNIKRSGQEAFYLSVLPTEITVISGESYDLNNVTITINYGDGTFSALESITWKVESGPVSINSNTLSAAILDAFSDTALISAVHTVNGITKSVKLTVQLTRLKWAFTTGGYIESAPAIASDGTIYLGSHDKKVYAVNTGGTKKWELTVSGYIYGSPVIGANGNLYIGDSDGKVYAINSSGTKIWEFLTGGVIHSAPTVGVDGTIYAGSRDNKVYALNPDGTKKWEFLTDGEVSPAPTVGADGTIYAGSNDGKLYALNADGTKKWDFTTGGIIHSSAAIGYDGTIYVGSGNGKFYALNSDGTKKWEFTTLNTVVLSSPAIGSDGTIYVGSDDYRLYAINPSGTKKWDFYAGERISRTSPAVGADGVIYIGSKSNKFYAINPDGTKKWEFQMENYIYSSPNIASDGTIYIGSPEGKLYAIKSESLGLAKSPWPKFMGNNQNTGQEFGFKSITPSSITMDTNSSYNLANVEVMFLFPDGSSTNVTTDVVWTVIEGGGSINDKVYSAPGTQQTVVLQYSYTHDGIEKTRTINVSVIWD
jgi:outer membrane protein assembly factor BamB